MPFLPDFNAAIRECLTAEADVKACEEDAKTAMSGAFLEAEGKSVDEREHKARVSERYQAVLQQLQGMRRRAAEARARVEYLEKSFEMWRTQSANSRGGAAPQGDR